MDNLQKAIETQDNFTFECGEFVFFEKDDNGYYVVSYKNPNGDDFEMHYIKSYDRVIDYVNNYYSYEYCVLKYNEKIA